jgi:hypothetical protein
MTTKKKKTWTYPRYVNIKDSSGKTVMSVVTQLYQIGVYICAENGGRDQFGLKPSVVVKYMKGFDQSNLKEGYTSEIGHTITVTEDEDGFYKEVNY